MGEPLVRDSAMTALILGFFASSWFGWAQERPPSSWRTPLIAGAMLSLAAALVGGITAWRNWSGPSALSDADDMRRYLIVLGVEFGVAALGAIVLAAGKRAGLMAPWICLVVGVHFWPMAPILDDSALWPLGVVLAVVAIAAIPIARRTGLAPSAITGAGAGLTLLVFAFRAAILAI